jgi:hypothetical protein
MCLTHTHTQKERERERMRMRMKHHSGVNKKAKPIKIRTESN